MTTRLVLLGDFFGQVIFLTKKLTTLPYSDKKEVQSTKMPEKLFFPLDTCVCKRTHRNRSGNVCARRCELVCFCVCQGG